MPMFGGAKWELARFAVVGLGRIGLRVLWLLSRLGHEAFGIGISHSDVEKAKSLGLDAMVADLFASARLLRKRWEPDVVLVALPGSIGFDALKFLINHGFNVVDVSFFPENPLELEDLIKRKGVTVVVDAGVAPGLTNFLVGYSGLLHDGVSEAEIYVGGISRVPDPPLGLSPTWSVEDLVEEYTRPARIIRRGRIVSLDPLESLEGRISFPGVGDLEFFPTDGLRTLLYSYRNARLLIEYTLRWPGHLQFMRDLKHIGMLSERMVNVHGCPVRPKSCLARVIEYGLKCREDLVALYVRVKSGDGVVSSYKSVVYPGPEWTAMSIATSTFQVAAALVLAEGLLPRGLVKPEDLGADEETARFILSFHRDWGIVIDGA